MGQRSKISDSISSDEIPLDYRHIDRGVAMPFIRRVVQFNANVFMVAENKIG